MNAGPGNRDGQAADQADLSRRDFLRRGAAPVVAFIALEAIGGLGLVTGTAPKETKLSSGVIFPDPSLCIGCLTCEVICSQEHKREGLAAVPRIRIFNDPSTQVAQVIKDAYPDRGQFHQEPCLQCPTAECLYVCPVDALQVEPRPERASSGRTPVSLAGGARRRAPSRSATSRRRRIPSRSSDSARASRTTARPTRSPSATSATGATVVRPASSGARSTSASVRGSSRATTSAPN